jgi:hypothetical protein
MRPARTSRTPRSRCASPPLPRRTCVLSNPPLTRTLPRTGSGHHQLHGRARPAYFRRRKGLPVGDEPGDGYASLPGNRTTHPTPSAPGSRKRSTPPPSHPASHQAHEHRVNFVHYLTLADVFVSIGDGRDCRPAEHKQQSHSVAEAARNRVQQVQVASHSRASHPPSHHRTRTRTAGEGRPLLPQRKLTRGAGAGPRRRPLARPAAPPRTPRPRERLRRHLHHQDLARRPARPRWQPYVRHYKRDTATARETAKPTVCACRCSSVVSAPTCSCFILRAISRVPVRAPWCLLLAGLCLCSLPALNRLSIAALYRLSTGSLPAL